MSPRTETIFVSTSPGLEEALEVEARAVGAVRPVPGGCEIDGPVGLHQDACLQLRVANGVLLRVFDGQVSRASLSTVLARIDVSRFGVVSAEASGQGVVGARELEATAARAWRTQAGGTRLLLRLEGSQLTVSVDCAGELLFRRGYRQEVSRAPMRETLAAGMLRLAGYTGEEPLWDPMCGSGTLIIEGAWMARRRAPGSMRSFGFQSWKSFDFGAWERKKQAAAAGERRPPAAILGSDLNSGSLGVARRNAKRAGVFEDLSLTRADATTLKSPVGSAPGLVVCNLPYGIRVGEDVNLDGLHRGFGAALRERFPGWRGMLLVGGTQFVEALGLPVDKSWPVDNGGIPCALIRTSRLG